MLVGKRHVTTSLQTFQTFPNHVYKDKEEKTCKFSVEQWKQGPPPWLLRLYMRDLKKTVLWGFYDIRLRDYNISHYKDPYESTISSDSQAGRVSSTDTTRDQTPMVPWRGGRKELNFSQASFWDCWSHNDISFVDFSMVFCWFEIYLSFFWVGAILTISHSRFGFYACIRTLDPGFQPRQIGCDCQRSMHPLKTKHSLRAEFRVKHLRVVLNIPMTTDFIHPRWFTIEQTSILKTKIWNWFKQLWTLLYQHVPTNPSTDWPLGTLHFKH